MAPSNGRDDSRYDHGFAHGECRGRVARLEFGVGDGYNSGHLRRLRILAEDALAREDGPRCEEEDDAPDPSDDAANECNRRSRG